MRVNNVIAACSCYFSLNALFIFILQFYLCSFSGFSGFHFFRTRNPALKELGCRQFMYCGCNNHAFSNFFYDHDGSASVIFEHDISIGFCRSNRHILPEERYFPQVFGHHVRPQAEVCMSFLPLRTSERKEAIHIRIPGQEG